MNSRMALSSPRLSTVTAAEPRAAVKMAARASTTGVWQVLSRRRPWGHWTKWRGPRAAKDGSGTDGAQRVQMVVVAVAGGEPRGTGAGGRRRRSRAKAEAKSLAWAKAMSGGADGDEGGAWRVGTRRHMEKDPRGVLPSMSRARPVAVEAVCSERNSRDATTAEAAR